MSEIYLDYLATTPVASEVEEAMRPYFGQTYGNASSVDHEHGSIAKEAVQKAKQQIAQALGCLPKQIVFTSGATEAANLALQGFALKHLNKQGRKARVLSSPIEHPAIRDTLQYLADSNQIELKLVSVDQQGRIDLSEIEQQASNIDLFAFMLANNVLGNLYPWAQIAKIAKANSAVFFGDASQAVGKVPFDLSESGIDMLCLSGHKIYGPKGIGALVIKDHSLIQPLLFGGSQQEGLRPGTLDVPSIVGFGAACELFEQELENESKRIKDLRNKLLCDLEKDLGAQQTGDLKNHLPGALHITIPGIINKALVARLRGRVAISTGAACSSGSEKPSYVLKAIGFDEGELEGALRISIGRYTTYKDIEKVVQMLIKETKSLRALLK